MAAITALFGLALSLARRVFGRLFGLDPVIASVIDELIISLTEKSKVTSIIVTHEMESAFRIGTRMAMLYQGKIIEDAEPEQFKQSKNPVVRQFLSGSTEGPILKDSQDAIAKK